MKTGIHPKTYQVKVKCSCGNTFEVESTREKLQTEVCFACHPFYTGKTNVVDMTGQVDKFKKRQKRAAAIRDKVEKQKEAAVKKRKAVSKKQEAGSKSKGLSNVQPSNRTPSEKPGTKVALKKSTEKKAVKKTTKASSKKKVKKSEKKEKK